MSGNRGTWPVPGLFRLYNAGTRGQLIPNPYTIPELIGRNLGFINVRILELSRLSLPLPRINRT